MNFPKPNEAREDMGVQVSNIINILTHYNNERID